MVGKKRILTMVSILMVTVFLWGCASTEDVTQGEENNQEPQETYKIGITQLVEHPALDSAREGFIDGLASKGFKDGENIAIDFQNAQGDIPTAQLIAQNFVSQQVDMIFAIATPSAQAAFNATKEIPIVISAVTDPVEAGLVESWASSNTNVTGTSDEAPIEKQLALLQELLPSAKKVGIIYNTSEVNSEIQVEKAKAAAAKVGLEIVPTGVTNANEIPQALNALLEKVEALYLPTDNLVASSMPLIINETNEKRIPVIAAEQALVEAGALATEGIDYYELGFQTALMAVEVIEGKEPKDVPVSTLENTKLIINEDSATKLQINIPDSLKEKGEVIKGGESS